MSTVVSATARTLSDTGQEENRNLGKRMDIPSHGSGKNPSNLMMQ